MRSTILALLLFCGSIKALAGADAPEFRSGDIIFQTSSSNQSYAIMWASKSLYSHVGLIEETGGKTYVIEAVSKVSSLPLEKWIARGRLGRYAVVRQINLDSEKSKLVVAAAKKYLGRSYDLYFTSLNQEIYCSELVSLAYKSVGLNVGHMQKIKTLDVNNRLTRKLFESRWRNHPVCKNKVSSFDSCWEAVLNDELVTPVSIANDKNMQLIYSNYPM